jgi:MFS family permease
VYLVLLAVAALDAAGYSIVAPVVPAIAEETGAGTAAMGVLVASFALGMGAGFALAGRTVQRRGSRFTIALSLGLVSAGCLGFVAGGGYGVYLASRLLMGFGSGGLWIGVVFGVMERYPGQEYRRLTAVLAAYAVGAVAGPGFGLAGGIGAPFALLGLAAAALAVPVVLRAGGARGTIGLGSDRAVLRLPEFRVATAGVLLVALCFGILDGPLPLHFGERLAQAEIAALYVAAALVLGLSSVAAGRIAPRVALGVSLVLLPAGLAVAGATDSVAAWLLAVAVASLGFGLGEAGSLGVLLEAAGPERIVLAMVIWSQGWAVGYLVGPAAGGVLADVLGFAALGVVPALAAVCVAVMLAGMRTAPAVRAPSV